MASVMEGQDKSTQDTTHPTGISQTVPVVDCANPGNPVASAGVVELPQASEWYVKHSVAARQHPMYRTTSGTAYGARHNTVDFVPTTFHGKNNKFSEHLLGAGMSRDSTLNTTCDKTYICQPSNMTGL